MGRVYETEVICLTKCSKYIIIINRGGWNATTNEEFCKDFPHPEVDEAMLLDVTDIGYVTSNATRWCGMREYEGIHSGVYTIEEFRDFIMEHSTIGKIRRPSGCGPTTIRIGYFQLKNLCKKITTEMEIEFELGKQVDYQEDEQAVAWTESTYGYVNIVPALAQAIIDTY